MNDERNSVFSVERTHSESPTMSLPSGPGPGRRVLKRDNNESLVRALVNIDPGPVGGVPAAEHTYHLLPLPLPTHQCPMAPFGADPTKHSWTVAALGLGTAIILGHYVYSGSEFATRRAFTRYTAVDDLSVLGRERKGPKLKGTVVIAGGRSVAHSSPPFSRGYRDLTLLNSISGLLTALACVPQCENVVVIEPDEGATEECTVGTREGPHGLKVHTCTRKRIMQTFGFHGMPCPYFFPNIDTHFNTVYQPFILLALKRWFSNFEDHVLALGGMIKPWDVSLHLSGLVYGDPAYIQPEARCLPKHPNIPNDGKVPHSLYLSRVRFEPLLRRLVKQRYPDVIFIKGTVMSVVLDAMKKRVTGIEYTSEKGEKGERVSLECSLFVDCAGMARMGVKWLQKAGVSPPKVITYNANIRYGFSEYFSTFLCFKKSATSINPLVYLPIPPSVKYRLPIPGGIRDCQPVFYANVPLSIYDRRAIYGVKVEDDTGQSPPFLA